MLKQLSFELFKAFGQGKIIPCAKVADGRQIGQGRQSGLLSAQENSGKSVLARQHLGGVQGLADLGVGVDSVIVIGILFVGGQRSVHIRGQAQVVPGLSLVVQQQTDSDVGGGAIGKALGVAHHNTLTGGAGAYDGGAVHLAQGIGKQLGTIGGAAVDEDDHGHGDLVFIGHAQQGDVAVLVHIVDFHGIITGDSLVRVGRSRGIVLQLAAGGVQDDCVLLGDLVDTNTSQILLGIAGLGLGIGLQASAVSVVLLNARHNTVLISGKGLEQAVSSAGGQASGVLVNLHGLDFTIDNGIYIRLRIDSMTMLEMCIRLFLSETRLKSIK